MEVIQLERKIFPQLSEEDGNVQVTKPSEGLLMDWVSRGKGSVFSQESNKD